jgi:hypothetical protein
MDLIMELPFKQSQWYKPSITQSSNWAAILPVMGFYVEKNKPEYQINYKTYGVHTFLPQFCSVEQFTSMIDLSRPLTDEQAKQMYEFVGEQLKKSREKQTD